VRRAVALLVNSGLRELGLALGFTLGLTLALAVDDLQALCALTAADQIGIQ